MKTSYQLDVVSRVKKLREERGVSQARMAQELGISPGQMGNIECYDTAHKYTIRQLAKGKYFGICFGNDHITVSVIESVREMAEEGSAMHHCVYDMKYFQKADSLILSAKSCDGLRLETVEVNLKSLNIVQSRGKFNTRTKYHDEIISFVMANMGIINKAKHGI